MQGQRIEAKRRNRGRGGSSWILGLLALLIGIGIGFGIGYLTVDVVNATPGQLGPGSKQAWVDMTADSYQITEDLQAAQRRLGLDRPDEPFFEPTELAGLFDDRIRTAENAGELDRAEELKELAGKLGITPAPLATDGENPDAAGSEVPAGGEEPVTGPEAEEGPFDFNTILMACGGLLAALLVVGLIAVLWTRRRQNKAQTRPRTTTSTRNRASMKPPATTSASSPKPVSPPIPSASSTSSPPPPPPALPALPKKAEPTESKLDSDTDQALKQLFDDQPTGEQTQEINYSDSTPQPIRYSDPLGEFRTRYNYGDDGYDMSFSIETPNSEFLGECGVGISETLNKGTPQQATAFEVWLFDKDDIRTVTKVLLSEHAWQDEALRQHLAPKGELILVKEGNTLDLETKSLRVRARVREAEYGAESEASNGYFDRLVLELTPQQKQKQ